MPSLRNREDLLKVTLKKSLPHSDAEAESRVTRSSSQGRSKSFTDAQGYVRRSPRNPASGSKTLPTLMNITKLKKDGRKTKTESRLHATITTEGKKKEPLKKETSDISKSKEKEDKVMKEDKAMKEGKAMKEDKAMKGDKAMKEGRNECYGSSKGKELTICAEKKGNVAREGSNAKDSKYTEQNLTMDGLSHGKVKEGICTAEVKKRRKSVVIREDVKIHEKENINVNEPKTICGKSADARKSIDHASKRKNTIKMITNYTREELKDALLSCDDVITELQMKYKRAKALHSDLIKAATVNDEKQKKLLQITHERDELKIKLEYQKFSLEDQADIVKNKLEGKVGDLSNQISMLQGINKDTVEDNKKLNNEILHLKKSMADENVKKCDLANENKELKNTKNEMEEKVQYFSNQVVELEEARNDLMEQNKKNIEFVNKLEEQVKYLSNQVAELEKSNNDYIQQHKKNADEILLLKKCMEDENVNKSDQVHEKQQLMNRILDTERINNELDKRVKDLCHQVIELEETKEEAVEENKTKGGEILLLKKHLEDEDINKTTLLQEKQQLTNHITEMEGSKDELEGKVQDLQKHMVELGDIKRKVEEENKTYACDITTLNDSMEDKKAEVSGLILKNEKLTNDLTEAHILNGELDVKVQGLIDTVSKIEKVKSGIVEENRKLDADVKELKNYQLKLEETNSRIVKEYEQLQTEETNVTELDILNVISPHARKDSTKYFFVQDSVVKWIKNDNVDTQMMSIYKNLILDLQEVMDFYSLLSGLSIWKSKSYDLDNMETLVRNGKFTQYYCQLNPGLLNVAPNGYRFTINVNYEGGIIKYSPDVTSDALKTFVPKCLEEPASFNVDQSYMFLKNILENVK